MDHGHYNCRDYYITPNSAPTALLNTPERHPLYRHESFEELEQRSRSPASRKSKFPFLDLPLELRQHIYRYLLAYTKESQDSSKLSEHARNFSAVKKRQAKGMFVPSGKSCKRPDVGTASVSKGPPPISAAPTNVVWQRGHVSILRVSKQIHDECAEMIYGSNTFLLFVTYPAIKFGFRWILPSGLIPNKSIDFLATMPKRYLRLIKRVSIHVDHVDAYTGMTKFNVQGRGLAIGLRKQIQTLVDALRAPSGEEKRMTKVNIRVSNGTAVIDALQLDADQKINADLEMMLQPFGDYLRGVREVSIGGAVGAEYAERLASKMRSEATPEELEAIRIMDEKAAVPKEMPPPVCVYGNDME